MRDELYYFWISFAYIAKVKCDALIRGYGDLQTAFESIQRGRFLAIKGFGKKTFESLKKFADKAELEEKFEILKEKNIKFTTYYSKDYPEKLKNIYSAPIMLFYKGKLPESGRAVAIVGARAASEKGIYYAKKIATELSDLGINIISGMALGIDSAAHIGALNGKSKTYAILGCGVDICYPGSNMGLYLDIIKKGGVISEFPPGTEPLRANFPLRNRIISGLSDGVFVVEAREKSGSLITAELGLEQGKNIYALPGRSDEVYARGANKLIQSGAKLVNDVGDILEDFDFPELMLNQIQFRKPTAELDNEEQFVYDTLGLEPKHISEIMEETNFETGKLFNILLHLELRGFVRRTSFEYFVIS